MDKLVPGKLIRNKTKIKIINRILGPEEGIRDYSKEGHPSQGLIMRSIRYLFQKMLKNSNSSVDYYINSSFIEIYNEQIIDLLSDKKTQTLGFRYNKEDVQHP
jgi:hypothetical protein